jgi:hypothetical protein
MVTQDPLVQPVFKASVETLAFRVLLDSQVQLDPQDLQADWEQWDLLACRVTLDSQDLLDCLDLLVQVVQVEVLVCRVCKVLLEILV